MSVDDEAGLELESIVFLTSCSKVSWPHLCEVSPYSTLERVRIFDEQGWLS